MQKLSIGMFDSGVGGLTVLKEVRKLLPAEHIIYFGDTARVPYGNRSPQAVTKYALESALFLLTKGIKLLVIACNTSSALALNMLQKKFPIPVIGVIDPCAKEVVTATKNRKVGIIGTKATIKSNAYEKSMILKSRCFPNHVRSLSPLQKKAWKRMKWPISWQENIYRTLSALTLILSSWDAHTIPF
jgi:glutamate racemase